MTVIYQCPRDVARSFLRKGRRSGARMQGEGLPEAARIFPSSWPQSAGDHEER
jgi:hypothetical protein